ncbi:MAG: hypothetical protein LDL33_08655 [Desulfomonile sp.]|nr:hypothetical protein [Desulfomonile sp.]
MIFAQAVTTEIPVEIVARRSVALALVAAVCAVLSTPSLSLCETYGFKDERGSFAPKVVVTVGNREVLIKKTNPADKFTISLTMNKKNRALVNNVTSLKLQWINLQNQPGRPLPFSDKQHYDYRTLTYKEAMTRSAAVKIIDESTRDLFTGKEFSDLFSLKIDDRELISSDAFEEKDRTVQLGAGRDFSIDVDKDSIEFTEENFKRGQTIDVVNRSEHSQAMGVELRENGWFLPKIIHKREQTTIPQKSWDRFTVDAGSGFSIILVPTQHDLKQLAALDGTEVVIKVWDGNAVRDTRRIPIRVSGDLIAAAKESSGTAPPSNRTSRREPQPSPQTRPAETAPREPPREAGFPGGTWLWMVQIFNLIILVALGAYSIFFMLPRVQVLEDRLAKNEMFIHGSREAIREELEEVKHDILRQCRPDAPPE